mgnify:CR=1 FL=1
MQPELAACNLDLDAVWHKKRTARDSPYIATSHSDVQILHSFLMGLLVLHRVYRCNQSAHRYYIHGLQEHYSPPNEHALIRGSQNYNRYAVLR